MQINTTTISIVTHPTIFMRKCSGTLQGQKLIKMLLRKIQSILKIKLLWISDAALEFYLFLQLELVRSMFMLLITLKLLFSPKKLWNKMDLKIRLLFTKEKLRKLSFHLRKEKLILYYRNGWDISFYMKACLIAF